MGDKGSERGQTGSKPSDSPWHVSPGSVRFSPGTQHKVCLNEEVNGR